MPGFFLPPLCRLRQDRGTGTGRGVGSRGCLRGAAGLRRRNPRIIRGPLTIGIILSLRLTAVLVPACVASACATHEGTYAPDCIAFAGNSIRLDAGRFVWDRLTDQVMVDDAGEKVDPFPQYPLRGRYRVEKDRLIFDSDTGEELPHMYLLGENGRHYLLTAEQFEAWQETGTRPKCPLIRGGDAR